MTEISLVNHISEKAFVTLPFYRDGKPLDSARWGITLRKAGSMRFRWNEVNERRTSLLKEICGDKEAVSLELIHSKIVYDLTSASDTHEKKGDGMISVNHSLVPVVTVADCMPLYLYEPETGLFGVCHSGWKGTGIIAEAISLAEKKYAVRRENISVAIGPHIHDCCYIVDEERARYFTENFTPACVSRKIAKDGKEEYHLSLAKANLALLEQAGIRSENIVLAKECTSCSQDAGGDFPFGSFRRQAAFAAGNLTTEERSKMMTVQAAFCICL